MDQYKVAFVILHYVNIHDTKECINSILQNIDYTNYKIVVVDNGSPNKTGLKLKTDYKTNDNIVILLSEENLGFAKGNNIGFMYAKKELDVDFIVMINNDTIIEQKKFLNLILQEYKISRFDLLGPDIVTKNGEHQNPSPITLQNSEQLKKMIKMYKIKILLSYFRLDRVLEEAKKKIIKKPFIEQTIVNPISKTERALGVKLHGSALVFSKNYIKNYDGLYPKTFFYSEEAILHYIIKRDNLLTVYNPEIKIYHKEDSSTDTVLSKEYLKRRFYYKNFIKSGIAFLNLIEEDKRGK